MSINRLHNAKNPYQDNYKRVLCVCSAGLLRSPTMAWVLSQEPYNYNTRAAGIDDGHALIKVDDVLVSWADEIVVANGHMIDSIVIRFKDRVLGFMEKKFLNLEIPDSYKFRDPDLVNRIKNAYNKEAQINGKILPVRLTEQVDE